MDLSESKAVCDLKTGTYRQVLINESIRGQGHFLGQLHVKIKTGFSQIPLNHFTPNFVCKLSSTRK